MDQTPTTRTRRVYMKWIVAVLIAVVFFALGYFVAQSHRGSAMYRGGSQSGQFQGGTRNGMYGGRGSMNGTASGTPSQMPMSAPTDAPAQ